MLLIAFSSFTYGRDNAHVVNLRCDKMENPIVIESRQPVLQWQLVSDERGKRQTAYRIIVSGSLKQLNKGKVIIGIPVKSVYQSLSLTIGGNLCYPERSFIGK